MAANNPLEQVKSFLKRFTLQQKLALAGSGALVLVLLWVLVHFMNRVEYQTLYADLDPQEAQSIVEKLKDLKVDYELDSDGRTVRVASDKIAETRIQMASQGLPESGRIGFEIFDRTNFGLTNFQEQVNYQRALEGELARSIMTLAEVEAVRVHLALAKDSLFQAAEEQSKASVVLKLKNGRALSATAAQGIINMVAGSVKGLLPEKVTLVDYRGKVLSRNEGSDSGLSAQQLDVRRASEAEYANKIIQILEPAVGTGKVRPQVSATMNFQRVEETVEKIDPENVVVSRTTAEQRQPRREVTGGIPGPRATPSQNPADPAAGAGQADANALPDNLTNRNETINYETGKSVKHIVEPVGTLARLSVAVIIDNHTKITTAADGKPQVTQEPHTAEQMKKYKDLVAAAIAFNAERGDQLTIENVSFEGEAEFVEKPTFLDKQGPMIITALRYVIIPIVFIILYLLFLRPVKKRVMGTWAPAGTPIPETRPLPQLPPASMQTPMTLKQLEAQLHGTPLPPSVSAPPLVDDLAPLGGPTKIDLIRKRVVEHAQADPETVARLVRMWLSDERKR